MSNLYELKGAAEALIRVMRISLDDALGRLGVSTQDAEWIRAAVQAVPAPDSARPTIIEGPRKAPARCVPFPGKKPGQYLTGFEMFCANSRRWPAKTIETLHMTSASLVNRLPDPRDPRTANGFRIKGLVLGHVQSGKTANMAALIARAADHGYRLVIVLAGLYNDLRAQTQVRLDQDVTGSGDSPGDGPFVTHEVGLDAWGRLTRSGLDGDFRPGTIQDLAPTTPKLAVIKKNVRVLERFTAWLRSTPGVAALPALVIDDEADQASINSNYGKVDDEGNPINPSQTNDAIRDLLRALGARTYVGFTATPFANVLIDADESDDLFPEDFIVALDEPPGYWGARQLFGLGMSPSTLSPEVTQPAGLDVIRSVSQADNLALAQLTADSECPSLLRGALLAFFLSSAARLERGDDDHFTMFVHPSHKRDTHNAFATVLGRELMRFKTQMGDLSRYPALRRELTQLWESDFEKMTRSVGPTRAVAFDKVLAHLKSVTEAIEVKVLHHKSPDVLDYSRTSPRRRYIVVGGNRLSRGLTLEGLSISVFLRDTDYYDTLLQMGRWFGYRKGYEDLTRIYVDDQSAADFSDLARIELELRNDLRKYRDGKTEPREVVPLIRAHSRLLVTAPGKMGAATGPLPVLRGVRQVVKFPFDVPGALERNTKKVKDFVTRLGPAKVAKDDWHVWRKRGVEEILRLVADYIFADVRVINREILTEAIRQEAGLMSEWDVVIPGPPSSSGGSFYWTPKLSTALVDRAPQTPLSVGVVSDSGHVTRWRKDPSRAECAVILYALNPSYASGALPRHFARQDTSIVAPVFVFPGTDVPGPAVPPTQYVAQPPPRRRRRS